MNALKNGWYLPEVDIMKSDLYNNLRDICRRLIHIMYQRIILQLNGQVQMGEKLHQILHLQQNLKDDAECKQFLFDNKAKQGYENTKKIDDFHNLFKKDLIEVQNTLYKKFYKINDFKASKEYWDTNYNHGYKKFIKTYNPFTSVNNRILTKPSVSKIPISTARLLLITWSFLLITSTSIGENAYNYISGYKIFTGFPGKSIASIDIRNYEKSDRNDGFDDDKEKSE